jgi:hypothetical protein
MRILNSLQSILKPAAFSILFSVALSSCTKDDIPPVDMTPVVVKPDVVFFGVSATNQLIKYNAKTSTTAQAILTVTGLQASENILGIDFRPATGELYALGSTSRLYVINTTTGVARAVSATPFTPTISGTAVGFDFNPTVDRIRVVTNTGQNLRLNPETGTVAAVDGSINGGAAPTVNSVAYSGNVSGSTATVLYDIDVASNKLFRQVPPNNGTLVEVGSLEITATGESGFDISPDGKTALAALTVGGKQTLFQIDTASGKATALGIFGAGDNITGIAIPTNPVAYAVDDMNNLLIFNHTKADAPVSKAITGLQAGENILGIDFRLVNGQLFALGSSSRLYALNTSSGAATMVGAGVFAPLLTGTSYGFDFNPTVDRIRVIGNNGQNLRMDPNTGLVAATDGILNPGTPNVSAAAYTTNYAGATQTALYVIDVTTDKLYLQNPPNNGVLMEVGALGINIETANGFDIGSTTGIAYGIFTVGATNGLYSINIGTGTATKLFDFPKNTRGFTVGLGF